MGKNLNSRNVVIGERLAELRTKEGLFQAELGKKLGISESAVSLYENGKRIPNDEIKMKYAEYFKTTVEEIFYKK